MDFITKLPRTSSGFDSIQVVIDRATKMVHCVAVAETITAAETAKQYWQNVAKLHGIPKKIFSDRDPRFMSAFWKALWRCFGTDLRHSTAYHPQTQGQVERTNAVVEQMLRCTLHQLPDARKWDEALHHIELAINAAPSRSTGYSPFFLTFGYHPVVLSTFLHGDEDIKLERVSQFVQRLRVVFQVAQSNMKKATEAQKKYYDRRHRAV